MTFAIFPYNGEHAVAHLGTAKVCGEEKFQSVWVVDQVCGTPALAVEAMNKLIKEAAIRQKQEAADRAALARRR